MPTSRTWRLYDAMNGIQRFRQYEAAVRKMPVEATRNWRAPRCGPLTEQICADNPSSFFASQDAKPIPQDNVPDFWMIPIPELSNTCSARGLAIKRLAGPVAVDTGAIGRLTLLVVASS